MVDEIVIDALNRLAFPKLGHFSYNGNIYKDALDIIHRLQSENAEYRRKLEDGELVSKDWHDEQVGHAESEIERLNLAIEGLTAENKVLHKENDKLIKQVDKYKSKIEQGTLIELPCKVGDTVWEVSPFSNFPTAITVPNIHTILRWKEDEVFGRELFLTYAEAEKRLKELQNG